MSTASRRLSAEFPGTERFRVVRRIGAGAMGVVYEVEDRERGERVALKTLPNVHPAALYRFKQEFRSLTEVLHDNVVSLYELISDGAHWFFTMELIDDGADFLAYLHGDGHEAPTVDTGGDTASIRGGTATLETDPFGGATLSLPPDDLAAATISLTYPTADTYDLAPGNNAAAGKAAGSGGAGSGGTSAGRGSIAPVDLTRLKEVFVQLAEGVRALHRAGKLHRDLKPGNVLVRRQSGRVMLLDFGLVVELKAPSARPHASPSSKRQSTESPSYDSGEDSIVGTVAYMSPEQAAGASLGESSDWYAVGVMLFQALTGTLPFRGSTLAILVDKQTNDAPAPADLVADVPPELNDLCVALLRREPADRPTGDEVLSRLRTLALRASESKSGAEAPAHMPFVGRERHLSMLLQAFEAVGSGQTVVCDVFGQSGAGKSTLIERFMDTLETKEHAVVLSGRCYEQESVPYKGVDSLIDALMRYLTQLPPEELQELVPENLHLGLLAQMFPVLDAIAHQVGAPTADAPGAPSLIERRRLAFAALRELLARIGERERLVLHIDDVQWGDIDSAALLAQLVAPPHSPRLLLLLSYRSEYVHRSACLTALAHLGEAGAVAGAGAGEGRGARSLVRRKLEVGALSASEGRALALELLGREVPEASRHAAWIASESGGRALFVYELAQFVRSGMALSAVAGADLDEVLWMRVQRLPGDAQTFMEVVAVVGQPIKLRTVQEVMDAGHIHRRMLALLRTASLVRGTGPSLDDTVECFHDRIRESVVAHLAPERMRAYQTRLAQALEAALEARGDADPETVASHFQAAGQLARAAHYYGLAAEQAVRALAFDRAEQFYRLAIDLTPERYDKVPVYERMIHFYTDLGRFSDAYTLARAAVAQFDVKLPASFIPPLFAADFAKTLWRLRGRGIASLASLPTSEDARHTAIVRLICAVAKAAYQINPKLCVALATRVVGMCVRHGNTRDCTPAYMAFGVIFQGGVLGRHAIGHEFGRLSLALVEKYENHHQRAEIHFVVGYFGTSWLSPATEAEALWHKAYQYGLDSGDLFHTACACAGLLMSMQMRGVPMDEVWAASERALAFLQRASLREQLGVAHVVRQVIRNLRGQTEARDSLTTTMTTSGEFREDVLVSELGDWGSRHFAHFYYLSKLQVLYLWGGYDGALYERALEAAAASRRYLPESPGMLHSAEHHVYQGLLAAALWAQGQSKHKRDARRAERMVQGWAQACPANFAHKAALLTGEVHRAAGAYADALASYEAAASAAAAHGYLQIEALAHERRARVLSALGRTAEAEQAVQVACACYRRWGALAYADAVAGNLPRLLLP